LEVGYKFYGSGLESLPNIRRLQVLYTRGLWLVGVLATVVLVALLVNVSRLRERADRLRNQQITLELAHQMCHELRNGLWAFSLEGKNLRQFFNLVDGYFKAEPAAFERAAGQLNLEPAAEKRLRRTYVKAIAAAGVDPQTDLLPCAEMAKDAFQQIESFSRYINLTVEELDRNLLGAVGQWQPARVRLSEAWTEACDLLQMRFKSAGVVPHDERATDEDWINADRRSLVHVFVNLAKNATEAMRDSKGSRDLEFKVESTQGQVICTVHNRGRAIAQEDLPFIFRRGYSTKPGAGRGTGLALVHESISRMGGKVEVSSSPEDGTWFRLSFPQATAADTAPALHADQTA
jgi:signal transduction histidine kinase